MSGDESSFLARWSRRKAGIAEPLPEPPAPVPVPLVPAVASDPSPAEAVAPPADPPPTLDDVAALDPKVSDLKRFVAPQVDPQVKNAALKKLFADPQWNTMDGLDVYIDDYGRPDPLPPAMLRKLVQSKFLHLFPDEPQRESPEARRETLADNPAQHDDDPDLRLQPDDAAGPGGDPHGAAEDPGREP